MLTIHSNFLVPCLIPIQFQIIYFYLRAFAANVLRYSFYTHKQTSFPHPVSPPLILYNTCHNLPLVQNDVQAHSYQNLDTLSNRTLPAIK